MNTTKINVVTVSLLGLALFLCLFHSSYGQEDSQTTEPMFATSDLSIGRSRGFVRIKTSGCDFGLLRPIPQCAEFMGSGTVIGTTSDNRELVVLSCAHLFEKASKAKIEVADKVWNDATVKRIDRQADLSIMTVRPVDKIEPVGVAQSLPTQDDPLITAGYPDGSMYIERKTAVTGSTDYRWSIDVRPIGGESGGGLVGPDGLVGVIIQTERELEEKPEFVPGGYVVSWPVVAKFVATAYPVQRRYERNPEASPLFGGGARPNPNDRGPNPLPKGRRAEDPPLPPTEKKDQAPSEKAVLGEEELPRESVEDLKEPELTKELTQKEITEIEWSAAKLVILFPRQEQLDPFDWLLRPLQKFSVNEDENGLGKFVRSIISDYSQGKADVEVVYQRIEPLRYQKIVDASGVREGKFVSAVAIIKSQKKGLFNIFHRFMTGLVEKAAKSKLGTVPFEVVLEATSPGVFNTTQEALEFVEPDDGTSEGAVAIILAWVWGFVQEWLKHKKGEVSLKWGR